jgi:rhodanese-related sulfurtransferase
MRTIRILLVSLCLSSGLFLPTHRATAAEAVAEKTKVKNVSVDQAEKIIAAEKDTVVLDVRTPKEVAAGHIEGSKALNFYAADFKDQIAKLDKSKSYVVFCASGGRSAKACSQLVDLGFKDVRNVEGGMKAWENAGKKTVK